MAWFSYHGGHSGRFCRHARGTLEEVVLAAEAAGFTTYGLSEHCPRDRPGDLYPDESDLAPGDLHRVFAEYFDEARRLRDAFAGRLEILVGFETEVVPPRDWPARMRGLREGLGDCDYVVGSVHHVRDACIDASPEDTARAAEEVGGREALEERYFALVGRVAEELRPEVIGHFDLVRKFEGSAPRFGERTWRAIRSALEAVREAGSALDVNASPARRGGAPVYPLPEILERARRMDVPVTLGDDSHGPCEVGVGLDLCLRAIADAGYREVVQLVRREGHVRRERVALDDVRPRPCGGSMG